MKTTNGKNLLEVISNVVQRKQRINTQQGQETLKQLGLPEADEIRAFEEVGFIRFAYDLGDGLIVLFDWTDKNNTEEGLVEIAGIETKEEIFCWDDISEGEKALAEMEKEELRQLMPERSDNHLTILGWIRYADTHTRVLAEADQALRETKEVLANARKHQRGFDN